MKARASAVLPRLFLALLLVGGLGLVWRYHAFAEPHRLHDVLVSEPLAPAIFIAAHIIGSLFFVPRTVFVVAAGLIWGLWWGLCLSL
ncbi:MAG TPA: hypothetical protein VL574_09045, partial [Stellaceae bacterium]|nr:hypothetical protein [Stellaceae bacterium]